MPSLGNHFSTSGGPSGPQGSAICFWELCDPAMGWKKVCGGALSKPSAPS